MEEWNRQWTELAAPFLEKAMKEGSLGGWVKLGHNTGGPHNSKVLYFFEEWDHIDDLFGKFLSALAEQHPDNFRRMNEIIIEHDDVIWAPTQRDGM